MRLCLVGHMNFRPILLVGHFWWWFWFCHIRYICTCPVRPKPTLKHHFSCLSCPFPILAFIGSRDQGSGFLLPHLGIRGVSKCGVRGVGSPLRRIAPYKLQNGFLYKNTCWLPSCTCSVSAPCFPRPSLLQSYVCAVDRFLLGSGWREDRCRFAVLLVSTNFSSLSSVSIFASCPFRIFPSALYHGDDSFRPPGLRGAS